MGIYCVAMLDCADQKLAMMVTLTTISPEAKAIPRPTWLMLPNDVWVQLALFP
jgi:hypothetical protein